MGRIIVRFHPAYRRTVEGYFEKDSPLTADSNLGYALVVTATCGGRFLRDLGGPPGPLGLGRESRRSGNLHMLARPHGWSYEDLADGAGPFKNDLMGF